MLDAGDGLVVCCSHRTPILCPYRIHSMLHILHTHSFTLPKSCSNHAARKAYGSMRGTTSALMSWHVVACAHLHQLRLVCASVHVTWHLDLVLVSPTWQVSEPRGT
jgi:hypothetical protein